jgi:predicted phosphoadenosine phosphosulfate sulfurtransferase
MSEAAPQAGSKSRIVRYIDNDVLSEAKKRIEYIINCFDKLLVCFSGGKDSLVVLHLVEEVRKEMGISGPLDVIFRDEEVIPDDVIEFVLEHARQTDRFTFHYYAVPMSSEKFILGKTYKYIQWDPDRKWIREKPDLAIKESGGVVYNQYTMDSFIASQHKGRLAFINGIRTDESLVRLRSVVNKRNECFISGCKAPNVGLCKPIYDWSEKDVFKYFKDRGIKYCSIYNEQAWNGMALRVSTPLHAESAKRFGKIRTLYPVFYQQLIEMFPEMLVQELYWDSLDRYAAVARYEHNWNGVARYIMDEIPQADMRKKALKIVNMCKTIRENKLSAGEGLHNFGGYPVMYVFQQIINGSFKRMIQPCANPTAKQMEYEK